VRPSHGFTVDPAHVHERPAIFGEVFDWSGVINRSPRENPALQLLNDPLVVELLFGGGAGGGKSLLVTLWMVIQCRMYPGITIGFGS
jgi:predicted ribonuclease YlaK